jgi:hypothetical protein
MFLRKIFLIWTCLCEVDPLPWCLSSGVSQCVEGISRISILGSVYSAEVCIDVNCPVYSQSTVCVLGKTADYHCTL